MNTASLSDCVKTIVDNRGRTCPTAETGIPLIATNCIKEEGIYPTFEKVRFVSEETYSSWFRGHPEPGDIIFVNKGSPGRVCLAPNPLNFCIAQDMVALRANEEVVDPKYLFAALRSKKIRSEIDNMHVGTMIPHFKKGDFDLLQIPLPEMEDQRFIGEIYFDLCSRILCNQQINETLEGIAKALFKSWFVDFDPVRAKTEGRPTGLPDEISELFPNSFEESELGEIPSGWKVGIVRDLIERTGMGPFGSRMKTETFKKEGVPIIKGGNLKGMLVEGLGPDFLSEEHAAELESSCVRAGDIVLTHRGTLGQVSMVPLSTKVEKYVASQSQFYLRPSSAAESIFLLYFFHSSTGLNRLLANSSGVGVPSLARPSTLTPEIQITIPPFSLLEVFAEQVVVLQQTFVSRQEQQETLTALRDALLPRLISGELRVPDAEKMLEEVGI